MQTCFLADFRMQPLSSLWLGTARMPTLIVRNGPREKRMRNRVFAKAACGLTNAEGGVLVVGMRARATSKDEPDLVESPAPVADTKAVQSRVLDLIGQLVEPGIEGVQAVEVSEKTGLKSGFVIIHVPASEGPPRRSRKDWKFYLRVGSGTIPMEYFQIADMFGKRPHPKVGVVLGNWQNWHRTL
jgi:predicted HTH transcriptional regulator